MFSPTVICCPARACTVAFSARMYSLVFLFPAAHALSVLPPENSNILISAVEWMRDHISASIFETVFVFSSFWGFCNVSVTELMTTRAGAYGVFLGWVNACVWWRVWGNMGRESGLSWAEIWDILGCSLLAWKRCRALDYAAPVFCEFSHGWDKRRLYFSGDSEWRNAWS